MEDATMCSKLIRNQDKNGKATKCKEGGGCYRVYRGTGKTELRIAVKTVCLNDEETFAKRRPNERSKKGFNHMDSHPGLH